MKNTPRPTKSIAETMEEARENFKKVYGRLLTTEEAIKWTEEARKAIRKQATENIN